MADAIVWNLASKALELLAKSIVRDAASLLGARKDFEELESSIRMIQARVQDAERRQEDAGNEAIKEWLRRLKDVLYQADDLFDKVDSFDIQNEHRMEKSTLGKVGIVFSKSGPLYSNIKLANEIKSIRKQLDDINSDMPGLNLSALPAQEPPMARLLKSRETCSLLKNEVIGREDDKSNIINMICDDSKQFTVIPIVGFGGLGKTTLAQLVFNDDRIKPLFDFNIWVYVPEKDDLKIIKEKIYQALNNEYCQNQTLENIERGIIDWIETKKYLLVLDDLWYEGADIDGLVNLLKRGKHGSKVIVTTRLDAVAKRVGSIEEPYRLRTLTDDESRELFQNSAFGQESINAELMRTIGEDIVKMCGTVPLAIKVVGSSLKSKNIVEWLQVKGELSKAKLAGNDRIMATLKLSYDNLPLVSRPCFAYCSLFPKGYEFEKNDLVHLWMAQGYVVSDNGDQSFRDLLERNFFNHTVFDVDARMYKMDGLLHDLAKHVAGNRIMMLGDESPNPICDQLVHVNLEGSISFPSSLKDANRLYTMLNLKYDVNDENLFSDFRFLRALSMKILYKKFPDSIERLIHLRYLKIESNVIEYLPNSITKLVKLQTLNLELCLFLKELPRDLAKLINLRHLLLPYNNLTDLPPGFWKLASLQELNRFIVGKGDGIDSLGTWHVGDICIYFLWRHRDAIDEARRENLNDNNHQLSSLTLDLNFEDENSIRCVELASYVKCLTIWNYIGAGLPAGLLDKLSELVSIKLYGCKHGTVHPDLSGLPHLKSFDLFLLDELEYVEDIISVDIATQHRWFRSLEVLMLKRCYKLKGWTRASEDGGEQRQLVFPCLLKMVVHDCPMLMSMPLAPKLETLEVWNANGKMVDSYLKSNHGEEAPSCSSAPPPSSTFLMPLKELDLRWVVGNELISLSLGSNLRILKIVGCSELTNLRFESPNSIRQLYIQNCSKLNLSEGLEHLSVLEKLYIKGCPDLAERLMPNGKDNHLIQQMPLVYIHDGSKAYIRGRHD